MTQHVRIGHVKLSLPPGTPLHQRHRWGRRLAGVLDNAQMRPRGLPPQAIFVVNRLAAPQAGDLFAMHGGVWAQPPWRAGARLGGGTRAQIADLWREATRPILGAVPSACPAVWFLDRAEWLACLSLDLHRGLARTRWWWRAWLGEGPGHILNLATAWHTEVRWLPAATALLATHAPAELPTMADSLTPADAKRIIDAMVAEHRLPASLTRTDLRPTDLGSVWPVTQGARPPLPQRIEAAWLVTMALAVFRAPGRLQACSLAPAKQQSQPSAPPATEITRQESGPTPGTHPANESSSGVTRSRPPGIEPGRQDTAVSRKTSLPTQRGKSQLENGSPNPTRPDVDTPAAATNVPHAARQTSAENQTPRRPAPDAPRQMVAADKSTRAKLKITADAAPSTAELAECQYAGQVVTGGVATRLGGIWYLLTMLLVLDLLEDTADSAGATGPWDKLLALAITLFRDANEKGDNLPADPVWGILATLAGREQGWTSFADLSSDLRGWADAQLPVIADWLAVLHKGDSSRAHAASFLVQPAILHVTRTHIDIVFNLNQINLALRRAGFDRDPGWVPTLGRVITFHFG